jgi:hypothetical protein
VVVFQPSCCLRRKVDALIWCTDVFQPRQAACTGPYEAIIVMRLPQLAVSRKLSVLVRESTRSARSPESCA